MDNKNLYLLLKATCTKKLVSYCCTIPKQDSLILLSREEIAASERGIFKKLVSFMIK